jgi:hypothetical protein
VNAAPFKEVATHHGGSAVREVWSGRCERFGEVPAAPCVILSNLSLQIQSFQKADTFCTLARKLCRGLTVGLKPGDGA